MVSGYPKNKYKGFNDFSEAMEWLFNAGHDTFHFCYGPVDGPKSKTDEHSGQPECYVATTGHGVAIFERYRYDYLQVSDTVLQNSS